MERSGNSVSEAVSALSSLVNATLNFGTPSGKRRHTSFI
jgi:hypothetical protein